MHYFRILRGLRGCYMPDDSTCYGAATFREFCDVLRAEAQAHDLTPMGQTQFAWEHVKKADSHLGVCTHADESRSYGITVHSATAAEFFEEAGEIPPDQFGAFVDSVREGLALVTPDGALHNVGAVVEWIQNLRAEFPALMHRAD